MAAGTAGRLVLVWPYVVIAAVVAAVGLGLYQRGSAEFSDNQWIVTDLLTAGTLAAVVIATAQQLRWLQGGDLIVERAKALSRVLPWLVVVFYLVTVATVLAAPEAGTGVGAKVMWGTFAFGYLFGSAPLTRQATLLRKQAKQQGKSADVIGGA
jgi:hypothetical protein